MKLVGLSWTPALKGSEKSLPFSFFSHCGFFFLFRFFSFSFNFADIISCPEIARPNDTDISILVTF